MSKKNLNTQNLKDSSILRNIDNNNNNKNNNIRAKNLLM